MRSWHKKIWNDDSGFTLVELLVVIAIIGVVTAMAGLSYSIVSNANVNKAAANYTSVLSRARTESMAKGSDAGQLNLIVENGRLYYWLGTEDASVAPKEEICSSMIDLACVYDNANTDPVPAATAVTDGFTATIRFSTSGLIDTSGGSVLSQMIFSRGNRKVAAVLYFTGKNATVTY